MTQYSRTVIPGRSRSSAAGDLEPNMFGVRNIEAEAPPQDPIVRGRGEPRDDRRRDEAFAPLPGEGRTQTSGDGNLRGNLLLYGALAVFAVFGAVVWSAYSEGLRNPDDETAPLLTSSGPFKSEPVDLAESPVARSPVSEAEVFQRFGGGAEARPVDPELAGGGPSPATEASTASATDPAYVAPKVPPIQTSAGKAAAKGPQTAIAVAPVIEAPVIQTTTIAPPREAAQVAAVDPSPGAAISLTPRSAAPAPSVTVQPTAPRAPVVQVAASGTRRAVFVSGGPFVVQLAAPGSEAAAEAEWTRRKATAGDLFEGAEKLIVRADVNGKSVYRVRVGSFSTAAEADAFCAALKTRGGDCFRASR